MERTKRPRPKRTARMLERDAGLELVRMEYEITQRLCDMAVRDDMAELSAYLDACADADARVRAWG